MSARPLRVLVVDDEAQMVSIVSFALEAQGFEPHAARNAEVAWKLFNTEPFDLVVLDVMLPGASGVQLCERIRSRSDVPVMLLTARGDEDDRLKGLLAGADDYVTKPFSPRELGLRAAAIVRRTQGRTADSADLVRGPLVIDQWRRTARLHGRPLALSDAEWRLLVALARRAGEPTDWRTLLNEVWHTAELAGGRDMVKTAVYRLRHALGDDGEGLIVTVRGTGYLLVNHESDATPSA
ncbi:response regulator transcription factor [Micropruina sp.]|uniref:response regulator transcription factor n=1 Tax=Micropruina sp. TaxID=2737536 RepID=UPI0039E6E21A